MSDGSQVLVNHAHRRRSFADRGRHALAGAGARVAGGEDTRHARLEQERVARERPARAAAPVRHQVAPGEDEALRVALDEAGDTAPCAAPCR